mmetsp:Transcript_26610/g.32250  ORF Transcript_26610/g.32250 Transcript_26610/m.32250 type:complete len:561 (-) Transcript_26610:285-1967(-)|eukprot:CAMPEP_0172498140 /NCGR_PEP_ID=MMETSP1066-20121228/109784_1 /TAXON_ID=671091 /ORGANISM="Coscinodiscus wailesii, Strain CCMP2513" /LENGTH=560 /DNA_ID=CAMNT_0013271295 /DNA_START=160 /DNA_END=1842 /DNA_ORIENTATION=+
MTDVVYADYLAESNLFESLTLEELGEKIGEIAQYIEDTLSLVKSRLDSDVITGFKYDFSFEADRFTEGDGGWKIKADPVKKPVGMCIDVWKYSGPPLTIFESVFNDDINFKLESMADVERLTELFHKIGAKYAFLIERPALRATTMDIIANMQKLQTAADDLHVLTVDFEDTVSTGEKVTKGMEEIMDAMRNVAETLPTMKLSMNSKEYIGYEQVPETLGNEDDSQFEVYGESHDIVKHTELLSGFVVFPSLENLSSKKSFTGHTSCIRSLAHVTQSGGASSIVSCGDDGAVKIWNLGAGDLITKWSDHNGSVNALIAFELNGAPHLATASNDNTIKIWDLNDNVLTATLTGHTSYVRALATYQSDGKVYLISGSADKSLKIWDLALNKHTSNFKGHQGFVYALSSFSMKGLPFVASGGYDNKIIVWDLGSHDIYATLEGHTRYVWALASYMDGETNCLASGSADGTIKLWNLNEKTLIATLKGHTGIITALTIFVHQRFFCLASGDSKGNLKLWNLQTHELIKNFKTSTGIFAMSSFYDDGEPTLATGTYKDIEIWKSG